MLPKLKNIKVIHEYPEEYHKNIAYWREKIEENNIKIISDFNARFSCCMQPSQDDFEKLSRTLLSNPFTDLCMDQILKIHSITAPLIIVTGDIYE